MSRIKRLIIILFISLIGASATAIAQGNNQSWQPSRTWVVAVGILEWQDSDSFDSFPKEGRKDAELVAAVDSSTYLTSVLGKYAGLKSYPSIEALLTNEELDAILIATPSHLHASMVLAASR